MGVMSTSILVTCKADYKFPSNNVVIVLEKKVSLQHLVLTDNVFFQHWRGIILLAKYVNFDFQCALWNAFNFPKDSSV